MSKTEHNSVLIGRGACPKCRQSGGDYKGDNLGIYDDGHEYCFSCGYQKQTHKPKQESMTPTLQKPALKLLTGMVPNQGLPHRKISQQTCEKFDYRLANIGGTIVQVAVYYRDGVPIGQKVRYPDKNFMTRGTMTSPPLFGQPLWKGGGKRIVVTQGQIDAMSIYQATNGRVPVVSIPLGALQASKAMKDNLQWLSGYDNIVLCFDNDKPGIQAAKQCAMVLPPGRVSIAVFPKKDANEMLLDGKISQITSAINEAAPHRPDGVVHVSEVKPQKQQDQEVHQYPWERMTSVLWGRRGRQLAIHTSGSGMGKTTFLRQLMDHDLKTGRRVGILMLEESTQDSVNKLIGMRLGKPIHKILAMRKINAMRAKEGKKGLDFGVKDDLDDNVYNNAVKELSTQPLYLYDHFGSLECNTLMSKMEYMHVTMGCQIIVLDHISIVVSGTQSNNQRKDIDVLMTRLRQFVQRSGCRVEAVCHLTKPQGLAYEEGATISLNDLRGSGSLAHLSDSVIGYERNQQDPDKAKANTILVRSLKDRFSGYTGPVTALRFDQRTGRLNEVQFSTGPTGEITYGFSSGDPNQTIPDETIGQDPFA